MWKKRKEVWAALRTVSVAGDNGGFVWGEAGPIRPRSHKDETTSELSECAHTIPNNGSGQWGNLLLFNSVNLLFSPKDPVTQFPPALLNFVILNPALQVSLTTRVSATGAAVFCLPCLLAGSLIPPQPPLHPITSNHTSPTSQTKIYAFKWLKF